MRSTEDRRRVGLELTEEGAKLLRRIRARRTTWLAERLGQLDEADLAALAAATPALRKLLGERV